MLKKLLGLERRKKPMRQDRYIEWLKTNGEVAFIHINKCGGTSVERALCLPKIHDTALERIGKIGRDRWDALYTFALIRNPYDKVVSHYHYRVKTGQTGLEDGHISLDDWIVEAYGRKNPQYYNRALMFAPCTHWVCDDVGTILVNQVIKLEEIQTGWAALKSATGITAELPHRNATDREPVELATAARDVIVDHFHSDFEMFGYAR